MKVFNKKTIKSSEKVGDKMTKLRQERGWSISDLHQATRLEKDYIIAIESSAYHKLPEGKAYKKMFIKKYLSAFNVNKEEYLQQFEEEELSFDKSNQNNLRKKSKTSFKNIPLIARVSAIILLIISLLGYIGFQLQDILKPPPLALESPSESQTTNEKQITVKGKTAKEVTVSINGEHVPNTSQGEFQKKLELQSGLNTIIIKATKKHGKTTTVVRHVVVKEGSQISYKNKNQVDN